MINLLKRSSKFFIYGLFFSSLLLSDLCIAETGSHSNSSMSFSQVLSNRKSGYQFDESRSVTHEQIKEILEAGRLAPSSYNEQPWNFIVFDRNSNPETFNKALSALIEFNQNWAKHASVLIISVAANNSSHKKELNRWGQYDTGAAAFAIMLKATSLGLMAHQMGGFDAKKISKDFSIPQDYEPMSVMAIGYPSPDEVLKERKRKPLEENFFIDTWGKKFE